MATNFEDVGEFHTKFGLFSVNDSGPGPTKSEEDRDLMQFRINFMFEEWLEFKQGYEVDDVPQMADALIDLVYVALGTAHFLGLPWQELWDDVQKANMSKERAASDGSNSKRGSSFDVIKPEGWVAPDGAAILKKHGFEV